MQYSTLESTPQRLSAAKVGIVGFAQDIGASRRGVDMGPFAIRAEGLEAELETLGCEVREFGTIHCISMDDAAFLGEDYRGVERLKYLEPIRQNMLQLKQRVGMVVDDGRFPVVLGGDHSMAMGSLAGVCSRPGGKIGILWVDAHGDFNTPASTQSGNIHGMPLAVITGRGDQRLLDIGPYGRVEENNIVIFGARDLDRGEVANLIDSDVSVYTMKDIIRRGYAVCLAEALSIVSDGIEHLHLSFDMDAIDPMFCPGTGTSVPGGINDREALYLAEAVAATGKLGSLDLVEVNPALDHNNKTARFAVELIARAMGKRTL